MRNRAEQNTRMGRRSWFCLCVFFCMNAVAQVSVDKPALRPLTQMEFEPSPLTITQPAIANRPFTVTGAGGAILGMQDGVVELWQFPLKFFSNLRLSARLDGYPVPIDVNALAATLEVSPDHTTLTYSHAAFTIRQQMFVPAGADTKGPAAGGVILFQIAAIRPLTLTVSLAPSMVNEWPAPQWGQPGWDWHAFGRTARDGGAYVVSTDNPELFGMLAMPATTPGDVAPYQEHPHTLPLTFQLHFDPSRDAGASFPLLCEVSRAGEHNDAAGQAAVEQRLLAREAALPQQWTQTQAYYAHFFDTRLTAKTPDAEFDKALAWSELAIDKMQATTAAGETGLVAGWYPSFDSARPGFGWYFGRDTLWSIYAIDSEGDAALAREAIDFLIARQRADGKMMHEYSQTAGSLTGDMAWSKLPYEYAAADATPLYLLAMRDYVQTTGDVAYLREHWASVKLAYQFERTHDSDGDGVYDNSEGTGWVEGWPPKLPHQELYLAALDRDATEAMGQLASVMGDRELCDAAAAVAQKLAVAVDSYRQLDGLYAFSKNTDGTYDTTRTVYPAVSLWSRSAGLKQPGPMLDLWSSPEIETDWGARAVAASDPVYDPISYHQGAVWPLFTGWNAMAQYRSGRPLAGYAALMQNVRLTWLQDPGAVTEVLSGAFFQPLGRSSTHQLWSSAMVLAPAVRGLFGIEADALQHTLHVSPHLPAAWAQATLRNVRVGDSLLTLSMARTSAGLEIHARSPQPSLLCLSTGEGQGASGSACAPDRSADHRLLVPLPPVELELLETAPAWGDRTQGPRVSGEVYAARSLRFTLQAAPGSVVQFRLHAQGHRPVTSSAGKITDDVLSVTMPATIATPLAHETGPYAQLALELSW